MKSGAIGMMETCLFALGVLAVCCTAHASDSDWQYNFGTAYFGTASSSSDGFDSSDVLMTSNPTDYYVGTYHNEADGWSGPTGFYSTDLRSTLPLTVGQSKTWTFYMWGNPTVNGNPDGFLPLAWGWEVPSSMQFTLTYMRAPLGPTGPVIWTPVPVGTSTVLEGQSSGWVFPTYDTTDGTTGYELQFTATVIPEPSSLLALGSSLFCLAGLTIRRVERSITR